MIGANNLCEIAKGAASGPDVSGCNMPQAFAAWPDTGSAKVSLRLPTFG